MKWFKCLYFIYINSNNNIVLITFLDIHKLYKVYIYIYIMNK